MSSTHRENEWIIRLATIILASGEARGWSEAMARARKQVRG